MVEYFERVFIFSLLLFVASDSFFGQIIEH